ncbi:hypothetical protein ACIOD0_23985 [Kitasatospora albolonga]
MWELDSSPAATLTVREREKFDVRVAVDTPGPDACAIGIVVTSPSE